MFLLYCGLQKKTIGQKSNWTVISINCQRSYAIIILITSNKEELFVFSNTFAELPSTYEIPSAYNNDKTSVFEVANLICVC